MNNLILTNAKRWAIKPDRRYLFRIETRFYRLRFRFPFTHWVVIQPVHNQWFAPDYPINYP
jgi:hypothetical protein